MKFIYRGVHFNSSVAGSPSVKTGEIGTFLGKQYVLKSPQVHFRKPTEELIYRGVRYTR